MTPAVFATRAFVLSNEGTLLGVQVTSPGPLAGMTPRRAPL